MNVREIERASMSGLEHGPRYYALPPVPNFIIAGLNRPTPSYSVRPMIYIIPFLKLIGFGALFLLNSPNRASTVEFNILSHVSNLEI